MLLASAASSFTLLFSAGGPQYFDLKSESIPLMLFTECHDRVSNFHVSRMRVVRGANLCRKPTFLTEIHCDVPQYLQENSETVH
jgi:hypothetical protein